MCINPINLFLLWHYLCIFCLSDNIQNLSNLLLAAKQNNGIIYGNPLLTEQCQNVLLDEHKYNQQLLDNKGFPTPWFWSRESLDATINGITLHRRCKITHSLPPNPPFMTPWSNIITNEYSTDNKNMSEDITSWNLRASKGNITKIGSSYKDDYISHGLRKKPSVNDNIFYYHIEKSGSSSIGGILASFGFNKTFVSENWITSTKCGFTFVRDPIDRMISGYYTVNRLIYFRNIPGEFIITYPHPFKFKWYNISGEPQRFTQFVEDLMEYRFEFIKETPLEHIMSQTSILSVTQSDIHFIGRLNKLKTHWNELYKLCGNDKLKQYPKKRYQWMQNFGVLGFNRIKHLEYFEMMDLMSWRYGMLLPAYKAIADNYDLYHKIVHYYRQDYICFGFNHNFNEFRYKVYQQHPLTNCVNSFFYLKCKDMYLLILIATVLSF